MSEPAPRRTRARAAGTRTETGLHGSRAPRTRTGPAPRVRPRTRRGRTRAATRRDAARAEVCDVSPPWSVRAARALSYLAHRAPVRHAVVIALSPRPDA